MYCKFAGKQQNYHIKVDDELKADCNVWLHFLMIENLVCRPFVDFTTTLTAEKLFFFTVTAGAEKLGFGAIFNRHWTYVNGNQDSLRISGPV